MVGNIIKRLFDISLAIIILILASPILIITALSSIYFLGRPIFFRQTRPGLHGQPFQMTKLRTMRNDCDEHGNLLSDADRLTSYGKFLRASSLDELPGLWNVIKGDMSLVGPRPLLMQYLPLYNERQMRRHEMRPGITGWAQVKGRNSLSWNEKFEYDIWYIDNHSFWLDVKILFLTAWVVLARKNIASEGNATMPAFLGNRDNS